jgi:O-antigen biosynthesis protein
VTEYPEPLVSKVFASAFADEALFIERLGGDKSDPEVIRRYLGLPLAARPELAVFFNREFYWQRYPDIRSVDIDPLVHFMEWGVLEGRMPHPLIDVAAMQAAAPGLLPPLSTIDALYDVLSRDLVDPGPHFSLGFYRSQLDGSETIEGGLLRHFLERGILRGLKPNPSFDPLAYYRDSERKSFDVRSSLRALALPGGGRPREAAAEPVSEEQAKRLFRAKAEAAQLFHGRTPLRFEVAGLPDVSVIMVMHNDFALNLLALASLRANYTGPIEVIVIDRGSADETHHLSRYVSGAIVLQFDSNISLVRGRNAALDIATAETVLYLNNDVELAAGAIAAALSRLRSDPAIGAVGAKVVRSHGLLHEAGGIIWRDGWTAGYLRGRSPLVAEANFVRDVDYCSAVFLLAPTSLLRELGGFDIAFATAFYEDTDLCLRIRATGHRVVYDPAVLVHHLEYGTSHGSAQTHIETAHRVFVAKHAEQLRRCPASDGLPQVFARSAGGGKQRVLVIEDQLPLRRLGSGFGRSNDIIGIMAGLGYHVTVFPVHPNPYSLAAVYADFPDRVEVMHDRSLPDLATFLTERGGYYGAIWVVRTHNLDLVKPILEGLPDGAIDRLRVVLDTEAISTPREAQRLALAGRGDAFDVAGLLREELRNAGFCRTVVAVNALEASQLQALGVADVRVIGLIRDLALTPRPWEARAGMLFVGALHTMDSPNYDSLCWFVDAVLPLIERALGYETRLTIAGFVADGVEVERFRAHPRVTLRGAVADLVPLYDAHRVFVAPTRFAAGIPYKIHEASSFGLPVVATEVLRTQLGWEDGRDLLVADASDAEEFARQVLEVYGSEALWERVRAGAAERVRVECGREECERVVVGILG